jgi:hypothetical protein
MKEKPLDVRWKVPAPFDPHMESTIPAAEPLLEARWIFIVEEAEQPMSREPELLQDALTQRFQSGPEIVRLEM